MRWPWRRKAPTMTLSITLMSSNVTGTWKVRARPRRACCSRDAWVTSRPRKRMLPSVGWASPARQLKNVLLPAPLGPIRPMISPSATSRSAPSTALNEPNALTMACASRNTGRAPGRGTAGLARREGLPERRHAAGLEAGDNDDDGAVDDESDAGAPAAEDGVGGFLQRDQDDGANQRPQQRAGAAKRRDDDHFDRD